MADNRTKEQRSYNMKQIRGYDTKPELIVRKYLHAAGYRYRLYEKKMPGRPDLVLPKYKVVIFINGCFWHGHKNCKYAKIPVSNNKFWISKIEKNTARDQRNINILKKESWTVIVIWECQLNKAKITKTLDRLVTKIALKN
jgi:DNA mismatch endonuclease (patch repair protein)